MARAADGCRVAVTGMGCVTAAGDSLPLTLAALDAGRRNLSPSPFPDITPPSPVFRCTDDLPDPEKGKGAAFLSRTARLAFAAALEALAQAGFPGGPPATLRVGVCIGTSVGASLHFFDYYRAWRGGETPSLESVRSYLRSNPSLALARLFGASGPAQTVANACSSGADAIGLAASWLRLGYCDLALAGGADGLSAITCTGFSRLLLASPSPCRPFDAGRSGLNIGEGAAVMVLEREGEAAARGARRLGRLLGYGTATDGHHLTAPHPQARGLVAAYAQIFGSGLCRKEELAFINAHGTATKTNDAIEGRFFREHFPALPVVATKGVTGHTLGAAGAVEAVLTLAHLNRGLLPASPGFSDPDPETGMSPVARPTAVAGSVAASQSLAFGGNNAVLVFGKGEAACA